ncbi:MAG: nucleoside hydrolase, partial [Limisphaerales bacterium]
MKATILLSFFLLFTLLSSAETKRPVAPWPPKFPVRMIIDTDADNEIDDQYAVALALGFPNKIKIEGFVVAHFGDFGGPSGIEKSKQELERVLDRAGMAGKFPIKRGAHPIRYKEQVESSEGIDFIIEQARKSTPEDPLWLVLLGPATDGAVALLKDPSIADRLIIFWHGRTEWPARAWNYNTINDIKAAQLLFELPCRFVLFDTGTYLRMSAEETKRRYEPLGPLGAYLQEIRGRKPYFMTAHKGFFDLGDLAAFADP